MTGRKFIVDIRRHRGNSDYAVELIGRFCSGTPGAVVAWLVRPDQAHLIPPDRVFGQADSTDSNWPDRIYQHLVQPNHDAQNGGTGSPFWVLSYDNYLLAQVRALSAGKVSVTTSHISDVYKSGSPSRPRYGPTVDRRQHGTLYPFRDAWPHLAAASLPIEEATSICKQVLRDGGHTCPERALPQKDLRLRMSYLDERAAKRPGDPDSESLIPNLVDSGLQGGWLKRFRRLREKSGTELLYLVEQAPALGNPTMESQPRGASLPAQAEAIDAAVPRTETTLTTSD
jgi:hypothetical protein